jgi:hypothetical protein
MHRWALLGIGLAFTVGCARLDVRKITNCDRALGRDCDIKGFRYYLSRPYVAVTEPIVISETTRLEFLENENGKWNGLYAAGSNKIHGVLSEMIQDNENGNENDNRNSAVQLLSDGERTSLRQLIRGESQTGSSDSEIALVADPPAIPGSPPSLLPFPEKQAANQYLPESNSSSSSDGAIKIIYLPDLDEQYAVNNKNFLAKSKYNLQFRDGWELVSVNGDFDSTEVAIELLDTIEQAIKTARKAATPSTTPAKTLPKVNPNKKFSPGESNKKAPPQNQTIAIQITEKLIIPPGLYRVNKPWETTDAPPTTDGLLAQLGLPTHVEYNVKLAVEKDN